LWGGGGASSTSTSTSSGAEKQKQQQQQQQHAYFCVKCPAGRYGVSQESGSTCSKCVLGKYQNLLGQVSCLRCDSESIAPTCGES
jgi:hypothetical protein